MATFHLQITTPERTLLSQDVDSVTCQTTLGQITILPGHAPLVATLVSGELIAKKQWHIFPLHVSGGFVQITQNEGVRILADIAERVEEIDEARAEEARARAAKRLQETLSEEEYAQTAALLERNLSRIRIARKHTSRHSPITSEGILKD